MSEIADFISQKEEIERLNEQIDMIAGFYKSFYKDKIIKLKKSLDVSYTNASNYKYLAGMSEPQKDKNLALELIKQKKSGETNISYSDIAKQCKYSKSGIARLYHAK